MFAVLPKDCYQNVGVGAHTIKLFCNNNISGVNRKDYVAQLPYEEDWRIYKQVKNKVLLYYNKRVV
jgi:hypothetical protein